MNDNKNTAAQPLDLDKLEALARAATPGPWELDTVKSEGHYGTDEDGGYGFTAYVVADKKGRPLMDSLNRDNSEIHEDYDGEEHYAWDELAKRDAQFIAAANPATVLALIDLARASQPEGATGTTGASVSEDVEFQARLCDVMVAAKNGQSVTIQSEKVQALTDWLDEQFADLRAQLAAKGQGEPIYQVQFVGHLAWNDASEDAYHTFSEKRRRIVYAAPASAQPDRGAALTTEQIDDIIQAIKTSMNIGSGFFFPSGWNVLLDKLHAMRAAPSPASQPVAPEAAHTQQVATRRVPKYETVLLAGDHGRINDASVREAMQAEIDAHRARAAVAPSDAKDATVPDHSEREAANAGGQDERAKFEAALRAEHGDGLTKEDVDACWSELPGYIWRRARKLEASQSPATIAAGQEAANAKDAK